MDLPQVRSFVMLAEQLHFGATARLLNLSQPALTKRIRQLEDEVGAELFERGRHGTRLTEVGRAFVDEARNLVAGSDRLLARMQRAARGEIGGLSVGFGFHTFELVPRVLAQLRKWAPEVDISLRDMSTSEQLAALRLGSLQVGFVRLPVGPDLQQRPVIEDALALVSSDALPLPTEPLRVGHCRNEAFVALSAKRSPTFRRHMLRLCAKHGFAPRIIQEADDVPTLLALARAGIGVAFVPASACRAGLTGVRVHPIAERAARWKVGAVWRKGERSVLVTKFLALLEGELAAAPLN
ncbi:MAG: LysR family transcriptional regulator [Verrucomicrobia bacterium]|nr:LysR family transcriptional regulator [Verrucomicrobiota bacterium]